MAICKECNQEMKTAEKCTADDHILINGVSYKRDTTYYDFGERCHDCGIVNKKGNMHHFGCDIERCPACGGQLIYCDCESQGT